jgi:tetratricopeptide (TPR) repeat protein
MDIVIPLKRNRERLFKELLNSFFNEEEAAEFRSLTEGNSFKSISPSLKIKGKDKRQIETKFPKGSKLGLETDRIILYAKEKLGSKKFIELLLSLGKSALDEGEGELSLEIFERVINESKGKPEATEFLAEANLFIADIYKKKTKWALSFRYLRKSKEIYKKAENVNGEAKCSNMLGTIYGELGSIKRARSCFEKSLELIRRTNDNESEGMIKINLGIIYGISGDYQKSRYYFTKALKHFEKGGDQKRLAEINNNLGMLDYDAERLKQALREFDRSIDASIEINFLPLLGLSFLGKAITYLKLENLPMAALFSDKALKVCNKVNDRLSVADIYKVKGIIERELGEYKKSENLLKTSLMMNIELGNKLNEAETSVELGRLYDKLKDKKKSTEWFMKAIAYYKGQGSKKKIQEIKSLLT